MCPESNEKIYVVNKLRSIRNKKKLSQSEVARCARITKACYQQAEAGKTIPSLITALFIARALDKTVDQLFYLVKEKLK